MRFRIKLQSAIFLLLTAFALALGIEPEADPPSREDPFVRRAFHPYSDTRWIGNAICYGPHRDGQRPGGPSPSAVEIFEDLELMLPNWNLMRIYGSSGFAETLLDLIRDKDLDMKVMLGVWIGPDSAEANRREVEYAIRLATDYPEIVLAASVGNETQVYWSAHRCSLDLLVYHVRHLRSRISIPVTVADDFNFWNKPESRRLASEIDFITMHAHPMWNGIELEEALNWLEERLSDVQAMHPEHHLVLGETGWATSVHDECEQAKLIKGKPGEIEQKFFYDAVLRLAATHNLTVFFFEAFDENWKGGLQADEVEKHWGLFRANRTAKMVMAPTVLQ